MPYADIRFAGRKQTKPVQRGSAGTGDVETPQPQTPQTQPFWERLLNSVQGVARPAGMPTSYSFAQQNESAYQQRPQYSNTPNVPVVFQGNYQLAQFPNVLPSLNIDWANPHYYYRMANVPYAFQYSPIRNAYSTPNSPWFNTVTRQPLENYQNPFTTPGGMSLAGKSPINFYTVNRDLSNQTNYSEGGGASLNPDDWNDTAPRQLSLGGNIIPGNPKSPTYRDIIFGFSSKKTTGSDTKPKPVSWANYKYGGWGGGYGYNPVQSVSNWFNNLVSWRI